MSSDQSPQEIKDENVEEGKTEIQEVKVAQEVTNENKTELTEAKRSITKVEHVPKDETSLDPTSLEYEVEVYLDEASSEEEEEEYEEIEEEILDEISDLSVEEFEDLFQKNTASFRCLAQILISRSSLLRSALYWFPPLENPGIDEAFSFEGRISGYI